MLRSLIRRSPPPFRSPSRGLNTSLLSQHSLSQLKTEAKRRGISPSGNKSTLITRIKHVENSQSNAVKATFINKRDSSKQVTGMTLDVKLPDLSTPQELPGPHIPFLPDFWDSSRTRGAEAIHHEVKLEAPMRKVLVVAGASTQDAGGPTYGHSDQLESHEGHPVQNTASPDLGFWADVATDLGLPASFRISTAWAKTRDSVLSLVENTSKQQKPQSSVQSRPLTPEEAKGVWVLLLIITGSWVAGGLFGDSRKKNHSSKL